MPARRKAAAPRLAQMALNRWFQVAFVRRADVWCLLMLVLVTV